MDLVALTQSDAKTHAQSVFISVHLWLNPSSSSASTPNASMNRGTNHKWRPTHAFSCPHSIRRQNPCPICVHRCLSVAKPVFFVGVDLERFDEPRHKSQVEAHSCI